MSELVTLEEAQRIALTAPRLKLKEEPCSIFEACGRVLVENIVAEEDMPLFDYAFYDGYALNSEQVRAASEQNPVKLKLIGRIYPSAKERLEINSDETVYVASGSIIPRGADTVARMERVHVEDGWAIIKQSVEPGDCIIRRGDNARKGQLILRRGQLLRPQEIALLCELNRYEVRVFSKPLVGLISVGDDLYRASIENPKGIYDNYAVLLSLLMEDFNVSTKNFGIIPDDPEVVVKKVKEAIRLTDFVAVLGGASVGENDLTAKALSNAGKELFHGVKVSPGKVSGLYVINEKPVFLVPCHVGSTLACYCLFIAPYLAKFYYESLTPFFKIRARLKSDLEGKERLCAIRFLKLNINKQGEAEAVDVKKPLGGSSLITTLTESDGYTIVPIGRSLRKGEWIDVHVVAKGSIFNIGMCRGQK